MFPKRPKRPGNSDTPETARTQSGALATIAPPRLWILSDGRAGHEAQTLAIAAALGAEPRLIYLRPRWPFKALAPFFPPDPRDLKALTPPLPEMALAAGRRTLPALRWLKQRGVFTVYANKPATGARAADVIVAPAHDGFFARNAVTPPTPANLVSRETLRARLDAPDPRIAVLPAPRVAMLIGGDSKHFRFTPVDSEALAKIARDLCASGYGVMATLSRRSPPHLLEALSLALDGTNAFLWDGSGPNPYLDMLAYADHIIVTADSVNMLGEAAATGAPAHVFAPSGGSRKMTACLKTLERLGAVRPWNGRLESWRYEPVNSTPMIAAAIMRAWRIFKGLPA